MGLAFEEGRCPRVAVPQAIVYGLQMGNKYNSMAPEAHKSTNINWLRAAVLGANDGIVSTASLIVGVAAANSNHKTILLAATAGLVAGAMSMAAGEYVSVSTQADTERADLGLEQGELDENLDGEREELAQIYVKRGLAPQLAKEVATQLMVHDALGSHARDELGITAISTAHPIQAAFASACSFSVGALLPVLILFFPLRSSLVPVVAGASILSLILLGVLAAKAGGAPVWRGALRVGIWGALAMAVTAGIGSLIGQAV